MLRRQFDGGDVLVIGQEVDFLGRRDVQDVDALAGFARQLDQAMRRLDRRLGVTDIVVAGPVAFTGQGAALGQAIFVFRVEGGAAIDIGQHGGHAGIVGDQQRAGRGPHEHLDAAAARQPFKLAQFVHVLMGAADIKGVVAMHAMMPTPDLVLEGGRIGRGRIGVRHFEDGDDTAHDRGLRAGFQIFLPFQTGLAEVDLGVDDARHGQQAGGVEDLGGAVLRQIAKGGKAPPVDTDIAPAAPGMVDDVGIADDQVKGAGHGVPPGWEVL